MIDRDFEQDVARVEPLAFAFARANEAVATERSANAALLRQLATAQRALGVLKHDGYLSSYERELSETLLAVGLESCIVARVLGLFVCAVEERRKQLGRIPAPLPPRPSDLGAAGTYVEALEETLAAVLAQNAPKPQPNLEVK
jgi:hypothetical protein